MFSMINCYLNVSINPIVRYLHNNINKMKMVEILRSIILISNHESFYSSCLSVWMAHYSETRDSHSCLQTLERSTQVYHRVASWVQSYTGFMI